MKRKADWTPEEEENLRKFPKLTNIIQKYIFENADNTAEVVASLPNNMIPADTYLDWILKDYQYSVDSESLTQDKIIQWFVVNHQLNDEETEALENLITDAFENRHSIRSWEELKTSLKISLEINNRNLDRDYTQEIGLRENLFGDQTRSELIMEGKDEMILRRNRDMDYIGERKIASRIGLEDIPPLFKASNEKYSEIAVVNSDLYDNE
jgi:hypothetical protein